MTNIACRGCGAGGLEVVLDLGEMPLANRLLSEDDLTKPEPRYPLALAFCTRCCLAQITVTVPPEELFRDYAYFSSVSDTMVDHARRIAGRMIAIRQLGGESLVVEVASNDGYLLQHYVARGIPVLGIDPARNIAEVATARGIPTIPEFFGERLAEELMRSGRTADVIHVNNVLAHVPDVHGFIAGLAKILKPGGMAVIETPYLRDLVERLEFDTIYHEHVFYYSLTSVARLLHDHGLAVADVERIPLHGGSLRLFVVAADTAMAGVSVRGLLAEEEALGLCSVQYFDDFASRVQALGSELRTFLGRLKADGQTISAYGAAAKGAVLLNAFGIGRETIEFVADRSPYKQGRFMPGVRIAILSPEQLVEARTDTCLILAWNLADEILARESRYRETGGKFVLPAPHVRIA